MKQRYTFLLSAVFVTAFLIAAYANPFTSIPIKTIQEKLNVVLSTQATSHSRLSIDDICKKLNINLEPIKEKCPIKEIPNMDCPLEKPNFPSINLTTNH